MTSTLSKLSLGDLRYLGALSDSFLDRSLVGDVTFERIGGSSHSNVCHGVLLDKRGKPLRRKSKTSEFVIKEYFAPKNQSIFYTDGRDPHKLFAREYQATRSIWVAVGRNLVAKPLGSSDRGGLYACFRHLKHPCAYNIILDDIVLEDHEGKEKHLSKIIKLSANFGGRVHSHATFAKFPSQLFSGMISREYKRNQITDDLAKILYERHRALGHEVPDSVFGLEKFVQDKYNFSVTDLVSKIVTLTEEVEIILAYQHGDLRLQHMLLDEKQKNPEGEGMFLDLEQFGERVDGRDLVTILTAEGGIAMPKPEDLSAVILDFLVYRSASTILNKRDRKTAIYHLDKMTPEERRQDDTFSVSQDEYAAFLSQVLSLDMRESLHIHASNVRSTPEQREVRREGIPNYSDEDMLSARFSHMKEILEIAADSRRMVFGLLDNSNAIGELFQAWSTLLNQLGFESIEDPLYRRLNK